MSRKILTGIIAIAVVIVLLSTILIPMVDDASKTTVDIKGNDNPSWIRMSYYTGKLDDSVQVSQSGSYIVGTQSGSEDVIFYADSSSVIYSDNGRFYLYNDTMNVLLNAPFTLTVSGYVTTVNDGNEYVLPQHSWVYFPDPDGHCTTYHSMDFVSDTPVAALSQKFAGVRAYNGVNGISMTVVKNGETVDDVYWGKKDAAPSPQVVPTPAPSPQVVPTPAPQNVPTPQNTPNRSNTYTHTVTYNMGTGDGGSTPDTVIEDYDSGSSNVPLAYCGFTKTNYHFIGWIVNSSVYQPEQTVSVPANGTVTATAMWEENEKYAHTIIYDPGTGTGTMNNTVITDYDSGESFVPLAPNGFTKTNWHFVGWLVDGGIYQPGFTIPVIGSGSVTAVAQWEEDRKYTHTITYDGNTATGGSTPDTVLTDYNSGMSNVILSNCGFTKTNWYFVGWSVNGGTYQPGQTVEVDGDQTIIAMAMWEEHPAKYTHTIIYDPGTGTGTMGTTVITDYEPFITYVPLAQNGFTKTNYHFVGWLVDGVVYQYNDPIAVAGNQSVTAVAQWEEDDMYEHRIVYNMGTGDGGSTPDTVIDDYNMGLSPVTLAPNGFTKTNWHFVGWLVDGGIYQPGQTVDVIGSGTLSATAQWEEDEKFSHSISYDKGITDATGTMNNTVVIDYNSGNSSVTLAPNGFTLTNFHFVGWLVNGTVYNENVAIDVVGNTTVTAVAQWEEDEIFRHTITYNGGGATSGSMTETFVEDYNSGETLLTLAPNGFAKTNWHFIGWSVNGVTYQPGQTIPVLGNQIVTAIALWEEDTRYTHTISYNGNGNTGGSTPDTVVTNYDNGDTMVAFGDCGFTKENWHFIGWKLYNQGPMYQPGQTIAIRGNATVTAYAQWEEDQKYTHTITYDSDGGTGHIQNTVLTDYNPGESDVILAECTYTKQYNTFAGWLVNGVMYNAGDPVKVAGGQTVTAVAVWDKIVYTSGDWNYTVTGSNATIVGYNATPSGTITIPGTVDGFPVAMIGNGTPITTTDTTDWSVDLSNVKAINNNAFNGCTHLIGAIVLSSDISYIGHNAFSNTGITDIVSYMGNATIENDAFSDSSVRELLNLGTMEIGNTSFGLNATVQTFLDTSMCIGDHADSYTEVIGKGNVYSVLPMISIILVAGVLIAVSGFILMKKE